MKINPVKIYINNPRNYQDVAILVDRKDYLMDLIKIRSQLGITNPYPFSTSKKYWKIFEKTLSREKKKTISKKERDFFDDLSKNIYCKSIFATVNQLAKKYSGTAYQTFKSAIFNSLIYNCVGNRDFRAQMSITIDDTVFNKHLGVVQFSGFEIEKPYIKICLTPYGSIQDLQIAKELVKGLLYKPPDTISNIKRDREWYWLHQNGLSYAQIKAKTKTGISKQGIIEAIKQYKKRITI